MAKKPTRQMPLDLQETGETNAKIAVQITPAASKNEIVGMQDDVLRIKINAPPTKGKANKELINYLSRLLGISKSSLEIVKGHTSKNKLIAIDGLSKIAVLEKLLSGPNP
ncbi:MAG: DUF167 domain-containing protein [Dehalococcoidales bacterium]